MAFHSELSRNHSSFETWPCDGTDVGKNRRWLTDLVRIGVDSQTSFPVLLTSGMLQQIQFPLTTWKSGELGGTNVLSSRRKDTCLMNQHLCRWWAREAKLELEPACPDGQSAPQNIFPLTNPTGLDHVGSPHKCRSFKMPLLIAKTLENLPWQGENVSSWCFSFKTENPDFEQLCSAILYSGS